MTLQRTWWRLKSPASRLFTPPFIQAQIKKNIKAPCHWPLWGEFTGDFPAQRASNAENVSIWWRHHDEKRNIHPRSTKASHFKFDCYCNGVNTKTFYFICLSTACSAFCSAWDQREYKSSAILALRKVNNRWPVVSLTRVSNIESVSIPWRHQGAYSRASALLKVSLQQYVENHRELHHPCHDIFWSLMQECLTWHDLIHRDLLDMAMYIIQEFASNHSLKTIMWNMISSHATPTVCFWAEIWEFSKSQSDIIDSFTILKITVFEMICYVAYYSAAKFTLPIEQPPNKAVKCSIRRFWKLNVKANLGCCSNIHVAITNSCISVFVSSWYSHDW